MYIYKKKAKSRVPGFSVLTGCALTETIEWTNHSIVQIVDFRETHYVNCLNKFAVVTKFSNNFVGMQPQGMKEDPE